LPFLGVRKGLKPGLLSTGFVRLVDAQFTYKLTFPTNQYFAK